MALKKHNPGCKCCQQPGTCLLCCDPPLPDRLIVEVDGTVDGDFGCPMEGGCADFNRSWACDKFVCVGFGDPRCASLPCGGNSLIGFGWTDVCYWMSPRIPSICLPPNPGVWEYSYSVRVALVYNAGTGQCQLNAVLEDWVEYASNPGQFTAPGQLVSWGTATNVCSLPATLQLLLPESCTSTSTCIYPESVEIHA